jgi:hypothetical protein
MDWMVRRLSTHANTTTLLLRTIDLHVRTLEVAAAQRRSRAQIVLDLGHGSSRRVPRKATGTCRKAGRMRPAAPGAAADQSSASPRGRPSRCLSGSGPSTALANCFWAMRELTEQERARGAAVCFARIMSPWFQRARARTAGKPGGASCQGRRWRAGRNRGGLRDRAQGGSRCDWGVSGWP